MKNKGVKRKLQENEQETEIEVLPPPKRLSNAPVPPKVKWINKQRVLVFASRGINHRDRHLMEDMKKMMPHHRPEAKMGRTKNLLVVNEVCEMKNCNKALMFEGRKKRDLYMWLSNVPHGPSAKFLVENVHTMGELKMTGNCLRGSRPLLSFDPTFTESKQYSLLKELFTQIFGVPNHHPKSQPFFDHVYTFTVLDNRIWFRNFQILSEDGALAEVGPRFVLNPIRIFGGSFGGIPLWDNPKYVSPSKYRQQLKIRAKYKYVNRVEQKAYVEATKPKNTYKLTPGNEIFSNDPATLAKIVRNSVKQVENTNTTKVKKTKKKKISPKNLKDKAKIVKTSVKQAVNTNTTNVKMTKKKKISPKNLKDKAKIVKKLAKQAENTNTTNVKKIKKKRISPKNLKEDKAKTKVVSTKIKKK